MKKCQVSSPHPSGSQIPVPASPAIHLHLGDLPLNDLSGHCCRNTELPSVPSQPPQPLGDDDDDSLIVYPAINSLLQDLHAVMPIVNFPQYHAAFVGHGIFYVDSIEDLSQEFLANEVGLPRGVIKRFKNHAAHLVRRAEKGKATEVIDLVAIVDKAEKENAQ